MASKTRNRFFLIFILAFPFIFFGAFFIHELAAPLPPPAPLPNPNGYNTFVEAGQMLASNSWDYAEMNEPELQTLVDGNSNALQLARAGLQMQCRVPLQFSETYISNHLNELATLKRLAQAFVAEGRLAEMENRPGDAAKSYLDTIHLGNESNRGGTLIDELVVIAINSIATQPLQKISGKLDAKSCRETAATLEALDSQKQTLDEIMQQEHDWSVRTFNSLRDKIFRPLLMRMTKPAYQSAKKVFQKDEIKIQQLIVHIATRAYELDKGKPPASLDDLVPDYLKAVPQDPFTGTNMVYSPR